MMENDRLGDCTCAGLGHAVQLTSAQFGFEITPTDPAILELYEAACGYRPDDPASDQGGIEQNVLGYVQTHGIPLGSTHLDLAPAGVMAVPGWVEVDSRNLNDIKRVIWEGGFVYVGADIPQAWVESDFWATPAPGTEPAGGHCFIIGGYDKDLFYGVSWGAVVSIQPSAIAQCVDEAYGVAIGSWFGPSGQTLAGLTESELIAAMQSIKS
jgi:hypothetical protein